MAAVKRTHREARMWQQLRNHLRLFNQQQKRYGLMAVLVERDDKQQEGD